MKWILLGDYHINTDQVQMFYWAEGKLWIWFAGADDYALWQDPERKLYLKLCRILGVRPLEKEDSNGEI